MKLEVGKFYIDATGRKLGPAKSAPPENCGYDFVLGGYPYTSDGKCGYISGGMRMCPAEYLDLIAEWRDEPEVEDDGFITCHASKYQRTVPSTTIDVYDVLLAFNVTCPARQHAIKKALMAGQRGAKDVQQDLDEAISALRRAKELAQ